MSDRHTLDEVYREMRDYVSDMVKTYVEMYNLPALEERATVTEAQEYYVRDRKFFVLICLYDSFGKVFLRPALDKELTWALLGGSVLKEEHLHQSVNRIVASVLRSGPNGTEGPQVCDIEPVAHVRNLFEAQGEVIEHEGIAFIGRILNPAVFNNEVVGRFVRTTQWELDKISRPAYRRVVELAHERIEYLKRHVTNFQDNEIDAHEAGAFRYSVHNSIVKRFLLTKKRKKTSEKNNLFDSFVLGASRVLDASCGDSSFINDMILRNPQIDLFVGNDLSWRQIQRIQNLSKKTIYTNHNAQVLPFRKNFFDVTFLANTLHHMPDRDCLINALESIFEVSRKVVLFEIEDPSKTGGFPKFLNRFWYHWFLKDQGVSYLSRKQFTDIINAKFKNRAMLKFNEFENIQGKYLICEIEKKLGANHIGNEFEVEEKFSITDPVSIKRAASENGFSCRSEQIEKDTYFSDREATFVKDRTCLRVRSNDAGVSIDFKPSSEVKSSRFSKIESNLSLGHNDYSKAIDFLRSMDFVPHVEVVKKRISYDKNHDDVKVSMVLDEVSDSMFCELEATGPVEKKKEVADAFEKYKAKLASYLVDEFAEPYRDFVSSKRMQSFGYNKTHLLFDLDDTIIPTETIFYECFCEEAREIAGVSVKINDYIKYETEEQEQYFDKFIKGLVSGLDSDNFHNNVRSKYAEKISALCNQGYFVKYFEKLEKLKQKYTLALVTMSPRKVVDNILAASNAQDLFSEVICREDVTNLKPAPDAYLTAIQRLGTNSENCIVVEDSKRGVIAATDAGLKVAIIESPFTQKNGWLKKIDCPIFGSVDEFAFNMTLHKEALK